MEQSFLAWLKGRVRSLPAVSVWIGDDAAIIDVPQGHQLVATTDAVIDQVDFIVGEHALSDIGYKAMAVNLSDIAAMGGTAISALVTLALPNVRATETAAGVYEGILSAAEQYHVTIAGGDISVYDGPLSITITMLGTVPSGQAWLRSGAREGDAVILSGAIGGSLRGRHLRPVPRLELVGALRNVVEVHAAIDISDGFSLDLDRLCSASGVGAEIDTPKIPIHEDAIARAHQTGRKPLDHALGDGEDFELILALAPADWQRVSSGRPDFGLVQVGNFSGRTGLWSRGDKGLRRMLASGFIHGERRSGSEQQGGSRQQPTAVRGGAETDADTSGGNQLQRPEELGP
jgi:thiamine-monophosphate kinase